MGGWRSSHKDDRRAAQDQIKGMLESAAAKALLHALLQKAATDATSARAAATRRCASGNPRPQSSLAETAQSPTHD